MLTVLIVCSSGGRKPNDISAASRGSWCGGIGAPRKSMVRARISFPATTPWPPQIKSEKLAKVYFSDYCSRKKISLLDNPMRHLPYRKRPKAIEDIRRKKYGELTALRHAGRSKRGTVLWLCECTCGETVIIDGNFLRNGTRKTCGKKGHWPKKRLTNPYLHHYCKAEYRAWAAIKSACYNKRHRDYPTTGKLKIGMYEPWRTSFEQFLLGVGKRPSPRHVLRRLNTSGSFVPGNMRWTVPGEK